MNKNQNYLQSWLIDELTKVKIEIHKLKFSDSDENKYGLETPQWQINGVYDGLLFRRDWLQIQIDELSKQLNK
jgi:hypothetical protein